MTTTSPGGTRTFKAGEALEPYRAVKLDSSGNVVYADVTNPPIGFTLDRANAIGDLVAVALRTCPDTVEVRLGSDATVGATLYGRDDGILSTSSANSALALGVAVVAGKSGGTVEMMQSSI